MQILYAVTNTNDHSVCINNHRHQWYVFLFLSVYERKLCQCVILLIVLLPRARQLYGLLKLLQNFSNGIKFLVADKVFMTINLTAAYVKMLHYFEEIDVNQSFKSKQCIICHYWYFLDNGYKHEPEVCNGCHDILVMAL